MTDVSWLNQRDSGILFGPRSQHVPVSLHRLRRARVLWVNEKVASSDAAFAEASGSIVTYEHHLLSVCAYAIAVPGDEFDLSDEIVGYADRYGGPGIGLNGGSGRAAVLGSYLVKGIGPTPLVSSRTHSSHASGGAYLEEAVRETIFSEIIRAEFPYSGVPILAIIDTGLTQDWGCKKERRVLVVRPCFLRPAHFVRATAYSSSNPTEGALDTARVAHMFNESARLLGKNHFANQFRALWTNWSAQLAYSFIHRLPHGSNSISNICFDAKMLDFGATSAVPSWGDVAIMLARQPFEKLYGMLPQVLSREAYFFGRYLDPKLDTSALQSTLSDLILRTFRNVTVTEMLRLAGVTRTVARAHSIDVNADRWWTLARNVILHSQREQIELVDSALVHCEDWDFPSVWSSKVPPHLRELRYALETLVPSAERKLAAARCTLLTATRAGLFREAAKSAIYSEVDPSMAGLPPERQRIEGAISRYVADNRRDQKRDFADAVCIGFAVNTRISYALFRAETGMLFALDEDSAGSPLAIQSLTRSEIKFLDERQPSFDGTVAVRTAPAWPCADIL